MVPQMIAWFVSEALLAPTLKQEYLLACFGQDTSGNATPGSGPNDHNIIGMHAVLRS
jgi:hypothetical protein